MITWEFKPSFDKSVKALPKQDKEAIKDLAKKIIDVLEHQNRVSKGLGFTYLRSNYYEIRASHKRRIILRWQDNHVEFILAGNHDQVRVFLKENA